MNKLTMSEIRTAVEALRSDTEKLPLRSDPLPLASGQRNARPWITPRARFAEVGEVERIPLSNALREDEDYANPVPGIEYDGRSNLRVRVPGTGGGRSLLFNTHLDVVPASQGRSSAFEPRVKANRVLRARRVRCQRAGGDDFHRARWPRSVWG